MMADITTYTLMNKNTPVLACQYRLSGGTDAENHRFIGKVDIYDKTFAPYGSLAEDTHEITADSLSSWWTKRSLPASKQKLIDKKKLLPVSVMELVERSYGLSLSDQYWVNDAANPKAWSEVNFFHNTFSDDVGEALLKDRPLSPKVTVDLQFVSPNATVQGEEYKKWKIVDGGRCLIKGGAAGFYYQQPYNELIATELYSRLLDPAEYVHYSVLEQEDDERPYSMCPDMVADSEELVPMADIVRLFKFDSAKTSSYDHYLRCCEYVGLDLDDIRLAASKMLLCDAIMANNDRHYNNFGFIRDVETLAVNRLAPFWDTGNSLYYYSPTVPEDEWDYYSMPFEASPIEQLKYISDYSWYDDSKLVGFSNYIRDRLTGSKCDLIQGRINKIAQSVDLRLELINKKAHEWQKEHGRNHIYVAAKPESDGAVD
jgi:hypothetical protein